MILMMTLGLEILLRAGSMTIWGGTGRPMPLGAGGGGFLLLDPDQGRLFTPRFVVAVLLVIYFWRASPDFLTKDNIANITWIVAPIAIIAIGEVLLLVCGELDLSVGFVLGFSGFLMHYLIDFYSVPAVLAVLLCLLMGVAVGFCNGFITVTLGVPAFITEWLRWGAGPRASIYLIMAGKARAIVDNGVVKNPAFRDYKLVTAPEIPEMDIHFIETMDGEGPQGAKGVGEAPAICVAAATANAIYNATGVRIYELPFTPEKVYRALIAARVEKAAA